MNLPEVYCGHATKSTERVKQEGFPGRSKIAEGTKVSKTYNIKTSIDVTRVVKAKLWRFKLFYIQTTSHQ